jgi:hypothetical protein
MMLQVFRRMAVAAFSGVIPLIFSLISDVASSTDSEDGFSEDNGSSTVGGGAGGRRRAVAGAAAPALPNMLSAGILVVSSCSSVQVHLRWGQCNSFTYRVRSHLRWTRGAKSSFGCRGYAIGNVRGETQKDMIVERKFFGRSSEGARSSVSFDMVAAAVAAAASTKTKTRRCAACSG